MTTDAEKLRKELELLEKQPNSFTPEYREELKKQKQALDNQELVNEPVKDEELDEIEKMERAIENKELPKPLAEAEPEVKNYGVSCLAYLLLTVSLKLRPMPKGDDTLDEAIQKEYANLHIAEEKLQEILRINDITLHPGIMYGQEMPPERIQIQLEQLGLFSPDGENEIIEFLRRNGIDDIAYKGTVMEDHLRARLEEIQRNQPEAPRITTPKPGK